MAIKKNHKYSGSPPPSLRPNHRDHCAASKLIARAEPVPTPTLPPSRAAASQRGTPTIPHPNHPSTYRHKKARRFRAPTVPQPTAPNGPPFHTQTFPQPTATGGVPCLRRWRTLEAEPSGTARVRAGFRLRLTFTARAAVLLHLPSYLNSLLAGVRGQQPLRLRFPLLPPPDANAINDRPRSGQDKGV